MYNVLSLNWALMNLAIIDLGNLARVIFMAHVDEETDEQTMSDLLKCT